MARRRLSAGARAGQEPQLCLIVLSISAPRSDGDHPGLAPVLVTAAAIASRQLRSFGRHRATGRGSRGLEAPTLTCLLKEEIIMVDRPIREVIERDRLVRASPDDTV